MGTVSDLVQKLDCSPGAAETFEALLDEKEGISVVQLSKKMHLPRPTLYGYLNDLIDRGLVSKGLDDDGARYYAETIDRVAELFDERALLIHITKEQFKREAQVFGEQSESTYRPRLFFYKNDTAQQIFRDILRSREPVMYWFWPIQDMLNTIPTDVLEAFNKERIRRGIKIKVLWPTKQKVNIDTYPQLGPKNAKESLREVRILPEKIDTLLGYGIYGTRVAFLSSKREHFGFILDSKDLSVTLKMQFDHWWEQSVKWN